MHGKDRVAGSDTEASDASRVCSNFQTWRLLLVNGKPQTEQTCEYMQKEKMVHTTSTTAKENLSQALLSLDIFI